MSSKAPVIEQIIATRKAWNISVNDVSELTGLHRTVIEGFEAGNRSPRLDTLLKWADALGCDIVLKVRGKDDRPLPEGLLGELERLGKEFQKVLDDNLWHLYER